MTVPDTQRLLTLAQAELVQGPAATVAVGTVTTGAAGTPAAVTNSGTAGDAVLDFTIPKGTDGTGNVNGPASAVDSRLAAFDGTTGKLLKDSGSKTTDFAGSTGGAREKVAALSATTGTATGDLNTASIFTITPTGNFTIAFSNIPAGVGVTITLIITSGATAYTPTFPTGTDWGTGLAPTLTANKTTIVTFLTVNGGTKLHARAA